MALKLMGIKRGMTQIFDAKGNVVPCTVIEVAPNVISQLKTLEKDGVQALQLAAIPAKHVTRPLKGHFQKHAVAPRRFLRQSKVESLEGYEVGQELTVDCFAKIPYVDVTAISKGKGYQGVMKRHNFSGGPGAHGSGFHRHGGSCGMRSSPGRCLPGTKKAGRMGGEKVTTQNLKVVLVNAEKCALLVRGAVPGHQGTMVMVSASKKRVA